MSTRLNSPDLEGALHFVTLNVRDRKKVFKRSEYALACVERLRREADRHPAYLRAFVVMPDHVHFLLEPQDGELTRFLKRFKSGFTLAFDDLCQIHNHNERAAWLREKGPRELWQDGKYSLPLWSRSWVEQKIAYLHQNPVRAGLVGEPQEFEWSSYGAYFPESGHHPPVQVDVYNPLS